MGKNVLIATICCFILCYATTYSSSNNQQRELKEFCNAVRTNDTNLARKCIKKEWVNAKIKRHWQSISQDTEWTLLTLACKLGHEAMAHLLLEYGANPNKLSSYNITPLMASSQANRPNLVLTLLQKNADKSITSTLRNETALDVAKRNNHTEIIYLLTASQQQLDAYRTPMSQEVSSDDESPPALPQQEQNE